MQKYKHGEKVRNWRWGYEEIENPNWKWNCWERRYIFVETGQRRYYGPAYRFRMDPVTSSYKNGAWTKYNNNKGAGKCWKREWYAARLDAKECYDEYGITFKVSDQIPYKYCHDTQRSWKRTKKRKQWM